ADQRNEHDIQPGKESRVPGARVFQSESLQNVTEPQEYSRNRAAPKSTPNRGRVEARKRSSEHRQHAQAAQSEANGKEIHRGDFDECSLYNDERGAPYERYES